MTHTRPGRMAAPLYAPASARVSSAGPVRHVVLPPRPGAALSMMSKGPALLARALAKAGLAAQMGG